MDRITLTGMAFFATHGVYAEEAHLGQRFEADIDLILDTENAGRTDDLEETVNYGDVYQRVSAVITERRYNLLEALARAICQELLGDFPTLQALTVRLRKPQAPIRGIFSNVEVEISRDRAWWEAHR